MESDNLKVLKFDNKKDNKQLIENLEELLKLVKEGHVDEFVGIYRLPAEDQWDFTHAGELKTMEVLGAIEVIKTIFINNMFIEE